MNMLGKEKAYFQLTLFIPFDSFCNPLALTQTGLKLRVWKFMKSWTLTKI